MADTGWLTAASAASVNTGDKPWSNPTNARTSNNVYATVAFDTYSDDSDSLALYNFTTGLPTWAKIVGIEVSLEAKTGDAGVTHTWTAKLVKDATNASSAGSDAKTSVDTPGTTEATVTFGSASDAWGTGSWLLSDFTSSTFGVWIDLDAQAVDSASVDCVLIKIYYVPSGNAFFMGADF